MADTRKRLASTSSDQSPCKRSRVNDTPKSRNIVPVDDSHAQCSVEAMLSVPLEVIFRDSPPTSLLSMTQHHQQQQRHKPLLTRVEAQTLIRTSQLAFEIDVLVQLTSDALTDKLWCRSMSQKLERKNNPFLKSLLPLLAVHGEVVPNAALRTYQQQLDEVLVELEKCVSALRQYSEQNWTVAESLMDALGYQLDDVEDGAAVSPLATEKRILGDIEEELCRRIESLLGVVPTVTTSGRKDDSHGDDLDVDLNIPMGEFCNRLFGLESPSPSALLSDACAAESLVVQKEKELSKDRMVVETPPKQDHGDGVTSSPDDDEPTEQESFEPSQERNLSNSISIAKKTKSSMGKGIDPESSTQSAAVALAVMFSGGRGEA